ncbi:MAG: mechanosensitive ion channel family protein [bacterium]
MMELAMWTLVQEGGRFDSVSLLVRFGLFISAYLVFSVAQRFWIQQRLLRNVSFPLNLLMMVLLLLVCFKPLLSQLNPYVLNAILAAAIFLGASIGLKGADVFLFDVMAQWRKRPQVPLLLRDIGRWVLSLVALILIIRGFFPGVNLDIFAMSSLVVGYIVGNATQDTLGNLFAGLALNTERPFQIGDWVTVSGNTGRVVDTTWRATRLRTKSEDYIIIPNASIARDAIINYSRPTTQHGCYLPIGVDYESPPNAVRSAILSVLADIPEVLSSPAPVANLTGYGDFSMNFTIKFFIADYSQLDPIQSMVMDRLWYVFKRQGIGIPYPIQDVRLSNRVVSERNILEVNRKAVRDLVKRVELFQSLSDAECEGLVASVDTVPFAAGETLCREGDPGDSFYVIRSGTVVVKIRGTDGVSVEVARLSKGQFFGEMSLLTGERRMASVVADEDVEVVRVSSQDFAALLKANSELASKLAAALEKRLAGRQAHLAISSTKMPVPENQSMLAARIRRFFGLV